MPFEIREIVLQAQVIEPDAETSQPPDAPLGEDGEANRALLTEMRRMIQEELDRRARR